uniref:Uncharacterized protein n=1 Tax=Arundo donax TaxID=35708 RepID=A0A0A8ZC11_ARUDO
MFNFPEFFRQNRIYQSKSLRLFCITFISCCRLHLIVLSRFSALSRLSFTMFWELLSIQGKCVNFPLHFTPKKVLFI